VSHELPEGFRPGDPTARDQSSTDEARVSFKFVEGRGGGTPRVLLEVDEPGLPALQRGDSFLGLHFREGVTFEEARAFAHQMDRLLDSISHTTFIT
jgi:hypothetical protein